MEVNVNGDTAEIKTGALGIRHKLSQSEKEELKLLINSAGWKIYRSILLAGKEGYQMSMYPSSNPNEVLKTLGTVVGINFAANQLGALVEQIKQGERVAERSTNQT